MSIILKMFLNSNFRRYSITFRYSHRQSVQFSEKNIKAALFIRTFIKKNTIVSRNDNLVIPSSFFSLYFLQRKGSILNFLLFLSFTFRVCNIISNYSRLMTSSWSILSFSTDSSIKKQRKFWSSFKKNVPFRICLDLMYLIPSLRYLSVNSIRSLRYLYNLLSTSIIFFRRCISLQNLLIYLSWIISCISSNFCILTLLYLFIVDQ